jgi:hypothetical protein
LPQRAQRVKEALNLIAFVLFVANNIPLQKMPHPVGVFNVINYGKNCYRKTGKLELLEGSRYEKPYAKRISRVPVVVQRFVRRRGGAVPASRGAAGAGRSGGAIAEAGIWGIEADPKFVQ